MCMCVWVWVGGDVCVWVCVVFAYEISTVVWLRFGSTHHFLLLSSQVPKFVQLLGPDRSEYLLRQPCVRCWSPSTVCSFLVTACVCVHFGHRGWSWYEPLVVNSLNSHMEMRCSSVQNELLLHVNIVACLVSVVNIGPTNSAQVIEPEPSWSNFDQHLRISTSLSKIAGSKPWHTSRNSP